MTANVQKDSVLHDHTVTFYNSRTTFFSQNLINWALPSLLLPTESVVLLLRKSNGDIFLNRLKGDFQLDVESLKKEKRLVMFDAEDLLRRFFDENFDADMAAFEKFQTELFDSVQQFKKVRLCGEVVSLLAEMGQIKKSIELEKLWNAKCALRSITILCSYAAFTEECAEYDELCDAHSHVIPSENFVGIKVQQRLMSSWKAQLDMLLQEREAAANAENHVRNLTAFVAYLCHELRNPLHGVYGSLSLIQHNFDKLQELIATASVPSLPAKDRSAEEGGFADEHQAKVQEICDQLRSSINDVQSCVAYQTTILNDNLDVARLAEGKLELDMKEIQLSSALSDVVKMFISTAAKKNLSISLSLGSNEKSHEIVGRGDLSRIKQVLSNLLTNAIKFTEKGKIDVALVVPKEVCPSMANDSKRGEKTHAGQFELVVKDTGVGISPIQMQRLFNRFSQAQNMTVGDKYSGSGLGLYIARNLSRLMGGDLLIESQVNVGSTFRFIFCLDRPTCSCQQGPQQKQEQQEQRTRRAASNIAVAAEMALATSSFAQLQLQNHQLEQKKEHVSSPTVDSSTNLKERRGSLSPERTEHIRQRRNSTGAVSGSTGGPAPRRVLIVDDNEINRRILGSFLKDFPDTELHYAVDGEEALRLHLQFSFQLILMDIHMPNMDGLQSTRIIRQIESAKHQVGPSDSEKAAGDNVGCSRTSSSSSTPSYWTVPIIAITANSLESQRKEALSAGMDDLLCKPFLRPDIRKVVDKWLNHT